MTSKPRIVLGGAPQGSILGVFLFNVTIDNFESDSADVAEYRSVGGTKNTTFPQHDPSLNVPVEVPYNRPGFRAWLDLPLEVLKYVDNNLIIEKICLHGMIIDKNGIKLAHTVRTQNLFWQIIRIARLKGMKVNSLKTVMLCVSDSRMYEAGAYFLNEDGNTVESRTSMKVLRLHFSSRPDMSAQVEAICHKFRSRIWYLKHLHHNGFSQEELLRVYKTTILPCHNYCSTVFHCSLTLSQSIVLKRLQAKALKAIYVFEPSYRELIEKANLTTLRVRVGSCSLS